MKNILSWLFDVVPFGISALALCVANGWILVRPADPEFSHEWRKKMRGRFLSLAVLTFIAGVACVLVEVDLVRTHP
jgi:hypothetical protein